MPVDPKDLKVGDSYFAPMWFSDGETPRVVNQLDSWYVYITPGGRIAKDQMDYWILCDGVRKAQENHAADLTKDQKAEDGVMTNKHGGKQSEIGSRLDLMPPTAVLHIGQVLDRGAKKYGDRNWRKIETHEHLAHAIKHIYEYLQGNTTEDQLSHAATRILFALEISKVGIETE